MSLRNDEMSQKRIAFLVEILTSVIARFEETYPDCKVKEEEPLSPMGDLPADQQDTGLFVDDTPDISDDEGAQHTPRGRSSMAHRSTSRSNSVTAIQSRSLEIEEGEIHRFGRLLVERNIVDNLGFDAQQEEGSPFNSEQIRKAILATGKGDWDRDVNSMADVRKFLASQLAGQN